MSDEQQLSKLPPEPIDWQTRAVGSELDPATYAKAKARLDRALAQPHLFDPGLLRAAQQRLGE